MIRLFKKIPAFQFLPRFVMAVDANQKVSFYNIHTLWDGRVRVRPATKIKKPYFLVLDPSLLASRPGEFRHKKRSYLKAVVKNMFPHNVEQAGFGFNDGYFYVVEEKEIAGFSSAYGRPSGVMVGTDDQVQQVVLRRLQKGRLVDLLPQPAIFLPRAYFLAGFGVAVLMILWVWFSIGD